MTRSIYHSLIVHLILGLSLLSLTAIASPIYPSTRQTIAQQQYQPIHDGSRLHGVNPLSTKSFSANSYNELLGRMMPGLSPVLKVHQMRFKLITGILPAQAAAGLLEKFFSTVATQADPLKGEWAKMVPTNELEIKHGMFRLSFRAIGDTIPWSFVKDFAGRCWEAAALGVADLFETVYQDETGRVAVQISLTLLDDAAVAIGSGSGSGSGSDEGFWREGSWESVQSGTGA